MVTGDADLFEGDHDDPKYHYSQRTENPAQPPSALRARSANEPVDELAWRRTHGHHPYLTGKDANHSTTRASE